jgi:hypothetical protein
MSVEAYPLQWPAGRKRTESYRREASNFRVTLGTARDELFAEIGRLGARHVVVSTNIPLRQDGKPYANTPRLDDPGVAAYFEHKGRKMCFACDRWNKVEDNMRAVAKTIDALRGVARWGTGDMLEAAFTGFAALPAPGSAREWWEVLGLQRTATRDEINHAARRLASEHHPDRGGNPARMAEINVARDKALQACA